MKFNAQNQALSYKTMTNGSQYNNGNTGTASNAPTYDRQSAMKRLAEMSLPADTQTMMSNVDAVIADAMQTINDSLKRSSELIDSGRQQLMQQHPSLSQAYERNGFREDTEAAQSHEPENNAEADANSLHALNEQASQRFRDLAQNYESTAAITQQDSQKHVMDKHAYLTQSAFDMQQQMLAKQQSYQNQLLGMDDPAMNVLKDEAKHAEPQSDVTNNLDQ